MPFIESLDDAVDPTLTFRPPAGETLPTDLPPTEAPPPEAGLVTETHFGTNGATPAADTRAGGYERRALIGRGGMGEVWEALQVSLGRVVAVKRPVTDHDTRGARLAAFRQEALVAAQLEHPNIVPVHDQGVDASGTPLLAMKLVQGRAWDAILREDFAVLAHEDLLARHLPILVDVVQAVAFAHSRGIIHRDLKPSQVMVGSFGEVMLMDWGLAMFVGDPARLEHAVRGEFPTRESCSNPSGTPALMAPEQTFEQPDALGEHTDVYLLGGTLYYLLTGTYPHQAKSARESFAKAARGMIDPIGDRTSDPVPPELEAICLAALEANPERRTRTAAAFLDALRDYLSGASRRREAMEIADRLEAVLARAPREYAGLAAATSDLARAMSLAPGHPRLRGLQDRLLFQYARAAIDREDLNLAEVQARQIGDADRARPLLEEVDRHVARRRRQATQRRLAAASVVVLLVLIAVGSVGFGMRVAAERDEANRQRERAQDAEAVAERRRADVEAKSDALRGARLDADRLVSFMLGDLRGRLAELERLDLLDGVATEAAAYYRETPFDELDTPERVQTIGGLRALCEVLIAQGDTEGAAGNVALAVDLATRARAAAPADPAVALELLQALGLQSRIAFQQGDLERALGLGATALELGGELIAASPRGETVRTLVSTILADQARILEELGRLPEAFAAAEEATRMMEEVCTDHPGSTRATRELASRFSTLGSIQVELGRTAEGLGSLGRSRDLMRTLTELEPANTKWRLDYAHTLQACGHMAAQGGDLDGAEEQLALALAIFEELVAADPTNMDLLSDSAKNLHYMAIFQQRRGRADASEANFRLAIERAARLEQRDPGSPQHTHVSVVLRFRLASLLEATDRKPEAAELYALNCTDLERLLALEPASIQWRRDLGSNLYNLGIALSCGSGLPAIRSAMERSRDIYSELTTMVPQVPVLPDMVQASGYSLASVSRALGDRERALGEERARLGPLDDLRAREPDEDLWKREKAGALASIASDLVALGRPGEVDEPLDELLALRPPEGGDTHWSWETLVGRAEIARGLARLADGRVAEGHALVTAGRERLLARIAATSLAECSDLGVWDLVVGTEALGLEADAAWRDHLDAECFPAPRP